MIVFTFRKLSPKALYIAAGIVPATNAQARENRDLYADKATIHKGEAIAAIDTTATKLTLLQKKALEEMNGFKREAHARASWSVPKK